MGDQCWSGQNRSGLSEDGLSQHDWGAMGARGQIFHPVPDGLHMRDVRAQRAHRERDDPPMRDGHTAGARHAHRWRGAHRRCVLDGLNDRRGRVVLLLRDAKDGRRALGARWRRGVRRARGVSPRDADALF